MGESYWGDVFRGLQSLGSARSSHPKDLRPVYDMAVKAGVREPAAGPVRGMTPGFAVPPGVGLEKLAGFRRMTDEDVEKWVRSDWFTPGGSDLKGASQDQILERALRWNREASEDPNIYAHLTSPAAMLSQNVYGGKFKEALTAALLSADRPKLLRDTGAAAGLGRDAIVRSMREPVVVFRYPGVRLGRTNPTDGVAYPGGVASLNERNMVSWARGLDRSNVPLHEIGHSLYHRNIDGKRLRVPMFDTGNFDEKQAYYAAASEAMAEAANLKRHHFMLTGKIIKNADDASDFMQSLLTDAPKAGTPDPVAQFGPRAGEAIDGYNTTFRRWSDMMNKSGTQGRARLKELLPKVLQNNNPKPVTYG